MHTHGTSAAYRERLTPSLWLFGAAIVLAPMASLVFAPLDGAIAVAVGAAVAVLVVVVLVVTSPVIAVEDGTLRAGRARIPVHFLGDASALMGEDARRVRGPGLDPKSYHLIRGGIDGVVVVDLQDPDDPVPSWVVSSRTPDRLAAAVQRAAAAAATTPRTPGR